MRTLIALLLIAGLASGQTLTLPEKLSVPTNKEFVLSGKTDCVSVVWYFPDGELPPGFTLEDLFDVPPTWKKKIAAIQLNSGQVEKTYRIVAVGANAKGAQTTPQVCLIVVGQPGPKPPEPKPPEPKPPEPGPVPGESLIVLILYESADTLSPQQTSILTAAPIRDYFDKHCVKGPDKRTPQARIWDKDVDASSASSLWQDAVKRLKEKSGGKYPAISISNGQSAYDGPLPANVADTLKLLKQYGGE